MTDALAPTRHPMSTAEALDAAFAGDLCELVYAGGRRRRLATDRWTGAASASDLALFVDPCSGPTLDVGCGPGRLTGALHRRGVQVLGVDISAEAVRQTRARGAPALVEDVFAPLPGAGAWAHVLLADGNIGLGGDPTRLLTRVAGLLAPRGCALVEVATTGGVAIHHGVRLRVGGRATALFNWATVGVNAIHDVAAGAGLAVVELTAVTGRYVATVQRLRETDVPGRGGRRDHLL